MAAPIVDGHRTIVSDSSFNADKCCQGLRAAFKGFGTDEKAVIDILTGCDSQQRSSLLVAYKTNYGKDLLAELKSELTGNFETVCLALMRTMPELDAFCCHQAIQGLGTDENCLIEILVTRTNAEIAALKEAYTRLYRKDLERDIKGDTSGTFRRILVSLLQGRPGDEASVDARKVQADCEAIFAAGEGQCGTDESVFVQVICGNSHKHFMHVFDAYITKTGHDIKTAVKREFSGDSEQAFLKYIAALQNKTDYFATRLYDSMKGLGTRDHDLIRLILSRAEIDLQDIKDAYFIKYKKQLREQIADECSGDYKKVLLKVVGPDFNKADWCAEQAKKAADALARQMAEMKLYEVKVEAALRACGKCPAGFEWSKEKDYYRCQGGSHTVTNAELKAQGCAPPTFTQ